MASMPGRLLLALAAALFAGCAATRAVYAPGGGMPYPLKEPPKAEEIVHVPTGLPLSFEGAMDMISGARLVCIGETHDNLHAHRVELGILRELFRRYPGKVAGGMEMFREPDQEILDRWTKGELSEFEFLKMTKWYENWGSDFGYYRDILRFARENRIDVIALNPSRELQAEVRRYGLDNVPERLKAMLPDIGPPDPYQRAAMQAVYGAHLHSEGAFDAFFRVQLLWEETMAVRVVDYLRSPRGEGKKMVTLTGGWHVRYGFGIPKKAIRRMPMPYAIVMPDEISIPEEKKDRMMDIDLPRIPLAPADFVWWVPYEGLEGKQAVLGVRLAGTDNEVLVEGVTPGSPAEKAGIRKGDRILSIDGRKVEDVADVFLLVREKRQGEKSSVLVRRDGAEHEFRVVYVPVHGKKPH
ncbi:MAG: PDZ domain-containing protein [Deltaproteobacteria bacterium]|nr:PDZ domain-containing protein [Deltaproteobacteria bacterium]